MQQKQKTVILTQTVKQQMLEHSSSTDVEVCGLLGGDGNHVRHYYPVENISDRPACSFNMSPQGQLDAMQIMSERNEELVGIFHSHTDSVARPSQTDLELAAYPDVINFIVSLRDKPKKLKSFRYDGNNFSRITIKEIYS